MDCRHIQFSLQKSKVDFLQLQALLNQAAFWARERTIEDLEMAVTNSNPVVTVWDEKTMIGFCRGISDGIYRATIWDVVIDKKYQGLGLGRKLVETALSHPFMSRVERVYLMTTYQQKFYERIGFQENQSTTMVLQNSYEMSTISLGNGAIDTLPKELDTLPL
ncbi:GNAT family N-acetyltransferase [Crocosphaera sp. XPORK-15E]|uniref:GNAT family N-acetyltransferase n=1 Tax=Crocosphaera sp. XPORK-15E TaxID=3110247 RepID=UPI002B20E104|nr:GNAT family N-acetyltransferase [Crocosphaera sp. XPORK-15E]MEA5533290.1 GNAT family N-acetyltransferase [Crocosphaera sp. XPORK-15E]